MHLYEKTIMKKNEKVLVTNHTDLIVWQKSMEFVKGIYQLCEVLPKYEEFCLKSQMRRSAVSVPANIAEGFARQNPKELIQFLYVSIGSISELDTLLQISLNVNYITSGDYEDYHKNLVFIRIALSNLIKKIKLNQNSHHS